MRRRVMTPPLRHARVLGKAVLCVAHALDLGPTRLARALGVRPRSILRLSRGTYSLRNNSKSWTRAVLLVRLHRDLESIMACDEVAMRAWMRSPNTALHARPVVLIVTAAGLAKVASYVESSRARV